MYVFGKIEFCFDKQTHPVPGIVVVRNHHSSGIKSTSTCLQAVTVAGSQMLTLQLVVHVYFQ